MINKDVSGAYDKYYNSDFYILGQLHSQPFYCALSYVQLGVLQNILWSALRTQY